MRLMLLVAMMFAGVCSAQTDTMLGSSGLRVGDKDFSLNLNTSTLFRFTYHDVRGEGGRGGQNGADFSNFRNFHLRTAFHGHIFEPAFQYRLWLNWGGPTPTLRIEDAWLRWAPVPLFNIKAGQFRVPASWEQLVGPLATAFPGPSATDQAFTQGWGKGVMVSGSLGLWDTAFDAGLLRWDVGVFNGALASPDGSQGRGAITDRGVQVTEQGRTESLGGGFRNNDFAMQPESFSQLVDGDLMVASRVEFHPMGEVQRHMLDRGALEDSAAWFFMVGLGANWFSTRTSGAGTFLGNIYHTAVDRTTLQPPASGRLSVQTDILHGTVDGHFRWLGFSLNWAIHYRRVDFTARGQLGARDVEDDPASANGVTDYGFSLDAGYFVVRDNVALIARFSHVDFDEFKSRDPATGVVVDGDAFGPDSYEYGAGLTWFIQGDRLKLSLDYRYVAQQLPHGNAASGLTSGTERISDWRNFQEVRLQLQWIF